MKNISKTFLFGLMGGFTGSLLFLIGGLFPDVNFYYGNLSQSTVKSEISLPISTSTPLEKIVSESSSVIVGIQVLKDNKLFRQGSGLIISSDGLIVTVSDIFVSDGVYQVFYDDQIIRGSFGALDLKSNLFILKTDNFYPSVANLNQFDSYHSGKELMLIGKLANLSGLVVTAQVGLISSATEKLVRIDTNYANYLSGFGAVDLDNKLIGIASLKNGKVNLVKASVIEKFFREYIDKSSAS